MRKNKIPLEVGNYLSQELQEKWQKAIEKLSFVSQVTNMETISNEEVCEVCQYFKFHHNEIICPPPPKHFTCLCELLKRKYICCKKAILI